MLGTYNGSGNDNAMLFCLIDDDGNKVSIPVATGLTGYINNLCFERQRVSYDNKNNTYLYPLPSSLKQGEDFIPAISFDKADSADYTFKVETQDGTVSDGMVFHNAKSPQRFVIHLFRQEKEVAKEDIEFSSMPIVEVNVADPNKATYTDGTLRIINVATEDGALGEEKFNASFRYRGATTMNYPKKSFNIKLKDDEGEGLDSPLMGIRNNDKWILDAMSIDCIKMRNRICFDIWNDYSKMPYETDYAGRNGTKGQFVEVILNGNYEGIYCLSDKIDRKLLDLKKAKEEADGSVTIRGLLYKSNLWDNTSLNTADLLDSAPMDTVSWNNWELQYPDDYPSPDTWSPLNNLYSVCSGDDFATEFKNYFYIDNVADFHLFVLALNLIDNGNKNMHLSLRNVEKANQFVITPWDLDTSLGGYYDGRFFGGTYDQTSIADERINFNNPFKKAWNNDSINTRALWRINGVS